MRLLSKLFGGREVELGQYVLRLAVRGPTGQTRHQFLKFEARSHVIAIQHAKRRAEHEHVLRWKLLDGRSNKEVASGWGNHPVPARED